MFVSILQLMGFPLGKPVHSRAEEAAQNRSSNAASEGISSKASSTGANAEPAPVRKTLAQVNSARRQEMKTQSVKIKAVSKASKAPASAKVVKNGVSTQKPKLKPAVSAKPTAKSPVKPTAKTKVKEPPLARAASKHATAGIVPKTAVKAVLKVSKSGKVDAVKAVKPKAKVKLKDSVKSTIAKATAAPAPASKAKVTPAPTSIKPALAAPAPIANASVPARAGRPSSRLAQLTVPSMAQSVASTAAKASFTQTTSLPLIVPPLASTVKKDPKLANNWKTKSIEQLTDAELIAMHDDEYMNDTQMAFFRRKLTQLKKDILSNAGETTEHLREDTVVVPDPADRATIEEEHALELRTRDRERKLLKKIEQSIARIDSGDYGYCDETGEPIGVGRLLARPTANLSLEAQQRRELKQKMFGD
jgi:DnaK suppressor protein